MFHHGLRNGRSERKFRRPSLRGEAYFYVRLCPASPTDLPSEEGAGAFYLWGDRLRARNLKPGFFKNEELAEIPFAGRLLFAGLWCMADRAGRLEDRPKRLRAEIFPYDDVDVEKLLDVITCHGFIVRYEANQNRYIQIINFEHHQNPHPHETASVIPEMSLQAAKCHLPAGLNPHSLNPHSLTPDTNTSSAEPVQEPAPGDFEMIWKRYPKKKGKEKAMEFYKQSVKTLQDWLDIQRALDNYLQSERVAKGFVQDGERWFKRREWRAWITYTETGGNNVAGKTGSVKLLQTDTERVNAYGE